MIGRGGVAEEVRVHTVPGSPFGRAVLAVLEEKRLAYAIVAVAPGALRAGPHLALHPFGRVPVLEHGAFILYETQAILRYLDRIAPVPASGRDGRPASTR